MAKIYAPNKQYAGISAGVPFSGGVAECNDPVRLSWFQEHGYQVEESTNALKKSKAPATPKMPADTKAGAPDGSAGK